MKKTSCIPEQLHSFSFRLGTLSLVHMSADLQCGLMAGMLPAALKYFHLDLSIGVVILTFMGIGCNMMQIPLAQLDKTNRQPRTLLLGFCMASLILFIGLFPDVTPAWVLCLLMLCVGSGVALVHPAGLRGVQSLYKFSPTVSTPVFMTGGFFGGSLGPFISGVLVEHFGLKGLLCLLPFTVVLILCILISHIRLARSTSSSPQKTETPGQTVSPWNFSSLLLIAFLMNTASTVIQLLLPTALVSKGYSLAFGGMSAMIFGAGSAIGSVLLGFMVKRFGGAKMILLCLALGTPLTGIYLALNSHAWAWVLTFFSGFTATSCYPQLVAYARTAPGKYSLSTRMSLIVGGTWGLAGLCFLGIGQIGAHCSLNLAMNFSWVFYGLAFLAALLLRIRNSSGR